MHMKGERWKPYIQLKVGKQRTNTFALILKILLLGFILTL